MFDGFPGVGKRSGRVYVRDPFTVASEISALLAVVNVNLHASYLRPNFSLRHSFGGALAPAWGRRERLFGKDGKKIGGLQT